MTMIATTCVVPYQPPALHPGEVLHYNPSTMIVCMIIQLISQHYSNTQKVCMYIYMYIYDLARKECSGEARIEDYRARRGI